jgi:hypothetical protein
MQGQLVERLNAAAIATNEVRIAQRYNDLAALFKSWPKIDAAK